MKRGLCKLIVLISLLFAIGCAHSHPTVITSVGQSMPNPSYYADVMWPDLKIGYYFVGHKRIKDLDGITTEPVFFAQDGVYSFQDGKYSSIEVVIHVFNPTKARYLLEERIAFGDNILLSRELAKSQLETRSFTFELPMYLNGVAIYSVGVVDDDGNTVAQLGGLVYEIVP